MVEPAGVPNEELWSMKAKNLDLYLMSDQEHSADQQAKWQAYVEDRTKAEAAQSRLAAEAAAHPIPVNVWELGKVGVPVIDDNSATIADVVPQGVSAMLAAARFLTKEDRAALWGCVVNLHASFHHDGTWLRSAAFTTRLYSPASTAAVDLNLTCYRHEMQRDTPGPQDTPDCRLVLLCYALKDAATQPHAEIHQVGAWKELYKLLTYNTAPCLSSDEESWKISSIPELHLTLGQLKDIRCHLFGGGAVALSDRLSDVELVQLLVVGAGVQWTDLVYRGLQFNGDASEDDDICIDHEPGDNWIRLTPAGIMINTLGRCDEGFIERRVRQMCGETQLEVPWSARDNPSDAKAKDAHLFGVDLWRMPCTK